MGINSLWDVLGGGEVWHIADYAAKHFKDTGRSLRIAVDEATWRFTNLTPEQVEKIRDGEPAANPVEKTILWRILRLWRLNIQLLFVYDGLRKPGKSRHTGRGGGKVDQECIRLLHQMFKLLKVPFHQAPGEAEAECAKLQRLGIVDAVWSDDGDSFMFGCNILIKAQKIGGKRVNDHVRVYKADTIAEKLDFDANSLVLFALLAGGDYDTTGLRGCGPVKAALVCKRSFGLAKRIVNAGPAELPAWRHDLGQALRDQIPPDFPPAKVLDGYRKPAVSTDDQCRNLRGLQGGWEKAINERTLRVELRQRYNLTTREYLKHLGPVFLARALANATTPFWRSDNLRHNVQLKSNRRKKDNAGNPVKCEVKVMYSAHDLVDIDLSSQPPDEDWSKFTAKDGTTYDPRHKIECEMLECLLQHGLPVGSWDPPVAAKKTRGKAKDDEESDADNSGDDQPAFLNDDLSPRPAKAQPEKRGRPLNESQPKTAPTKKKRKSKNEATRSPSPPPTTFRHLDISDFRPGAGVVDLLGDDSDDNNVTSSAPEAQLLKKSTTPNGHPKFRPLTSRKVDNEAEKSATRLVPTQVPPVKAKPAPSKSATVPQMSATKSSARKEPGPMPPRNDVEHSQDEIATSMRKPTNPPMPVPPTTEDMTPGQSIDPVRLRELRLAAMLGQAQNPLSSAPNLANAAAGGSAATAKKSAVIDLT